MSVMSRRTSTSCRDCGQVSVCLLADVRLIPSEHTMDDAEYWNKMSAKSLMLADICPRTFVH